MDAQAIADRLDRIYGYAMRRTQSREEAEELAAQIVFVAVKQLPFLRDPELFEPWLWGVARNVTCDFRRAEEKRRAMISFDLPDLPAPEDDSEEVYAFLRERIAMLSAQYREILILYYYEGLSVKTISERMNLAEGTVTWRLSEARKKLKKEFDTVEESALRPIRMRLDIYGNGVFGMNGVPFPDAYINDALSQNILYHCYKEPKSVEELANLCGVPAYYIEDRRANLLYRRAVKPVNGKILTDFILWTDDHDRYFEDHLASFAAPQAKDFASALTALHAEATANGILAQGEDSLFLVGMLAWLTLEARCVTSPYPPIPPNYDGNCWRYGGEMRSGSVRRYGVSYHRIPGADGTCRYLGFRFSEFSHRPMLSRREIDCCRALASDLPWDDAETVAEVIRDEAAVRNSDGTFCSRIPYLSEMQRKELDRLAEAYLMPLMPRYKRYVEQFSAGFELLFPQHLQEDIQRVSHGLFRGCFDLLVCYCVQEGLLPPPVGRRCEVIVEVSAR